MRPPVTAHTSPLIADPERLLTTEEAASLIGVTGRTLQSWAARGHGPKRMRIGPRRIRHRARDVQEWLADRYV